VPKRRVLLLIAQSLLGLGLLIGWLLVVDLGEIGRTLSQARWGLVAMASVLGFASLSLRAVRWRMVLRPVARVPYLDIWLVVAASALVNFVIPLRTAEIARSLFLRQRRDVPIAASLATAVVDRVFDLAAVLLLGAAGALVMGGLRGGASGFLIGGGILLTGFAAFVGVTVWARSGQMALIDRLLPRKLGAPLRQRILGIIERFLDGFAAVWRRPRELAPLFALGIAATLADAAAFYVLIASLGFSAAPMLVVLGYSLYSLTYLVPAAPGYVGSAEAFGSLAFAGVGLPPALAASAVVLSHAVMSILVLSLGAISLWGLGIRPASTFRSLLGQESAGSGAGPMPPEGKRSG
jgi:hypothetical protein